MDRSESTVGCTPSHPDTLYAGVLAYLASPGHPQGSCRAASVSERSEANDRGLFEILQYLYIYIYIYMSLSVRTLCKDARILRKLLQH